jgi:hypothetical protein
MTELWAEPSSTGPSRADHVCWPFHHHDELIAVARRYVAEGLARHERVVGYLSEEHLPDMEEQLAGLERLDECVARGQLQLQSIGALGRMDQPVDPPQGLSTLTRVIRESLKAGFTGLRMFGDMTLRMADPARRAEFVHYEHLADRFCLDHAYTALCAYDRHVLGDAAVAEVACVHPMAHGGLSPFQLSATGRADVALAGSVDTFSMVGLLTALQRIRVPTFGVEASVDVAALEFIDHRALVALDQHVVRHRTTLVLQSAPSIVARLVELIPLRAVRLEDMP